MHDDAKASEDSQVSSVPSLILVNEESIPQWFSAKVLITNGYRHLYYPSLSHFPPCFWCLLEPYAHVKASLVL